MSRMKTFLIYLILVLAFYAFSNVMINAYLKVSYTEVRDYEIDVEELFVDVTESKVSKRDGYIYGCVKNNNSSTLENKYLKASMMDKYGNVLGEKYVLIDKIEPEQLRKFEIKFDYDNVKTFKIEMTDTKPEDINLLELIKTNAKDLMSTTVN